VSRPVRIGRRAFLESTLAGSALALWPGAARGQSPGSEPPLPACAASGDVSGDRTLVWARATTDSRVVVEMIE